MLFNAGDALTSSQIEFGTDGCMVPVLFAIQTEALNPADADHILCTFTYDAAENNSDAVCLWRSTACAEDSVENGGDLIADNAPVILSDLEYDVQTDGESDYYIGAVYLHVPGTFDIQSGISLSVSAIPDNVVIGQSALSLAPYSHGSQNGISVTGNGSLGLFNSYMNICRNANAVKTQSVKNASSGGTRSEGASFSMTIPSYATGTLENSTSGTIPVSMIFDGPASGETYSAPRQDISINIPRAMANSLYDFSSQNFNGYLVFNYSESAGNTQDEGYFRITRSGNAVVSSGEEIPLSDFISFNAVPAGVYNIVVSLEALRHSETAQPITVTMLDGNHNPVSGASAAINVQPVLCGLLIDSNNDGQITLADEYAEDNS